MNVNSRSSRDRTTALHFAAGRGNIESLNILLNVEGIETNTYEPVPGTPLAVAIMLLQLAAVDRLLQDQRVNINAECTETGATAVHYAAYWGSLEIFQRVCQAPHANLTLQDRTGETPYNNLRVAVKEIQKPK